MNRSEARAFLANVPTIQAYADGKTIQYKLSDGQWMDIDHPSVLGFIDAGRYRIKPEPRTFYFVVYRGTKRAPISAPFHSYEFSNEEAALGFLNTRNPLDIWELVISTEVLKEDSNHEQSNEC